MTMWSDVLDILRGAGTATWSPPPQTEGRSIVGSAASVYDYTGGTLRIDKEDGRWDRHAAAMRCVLTTASNLAAIDLTVVMGDEPSNVHPVARLWNEGQPGSSMSARTARQVLFARAELHGESFAYLSDVTGPGVVPSGIHPIYDRVEVLIDGMETDPAGGTLMGFRVVRNGRKIPLLPDEVLWLRYPHPDNPWGALAPWKAALAPVRLDTYAQKWQESELANGSRPSSVVYLGDLDERAYNQAKAEYVGHVAGPGNGGKSLLVAGPKEAKVERLSMTPAEMSYLDSRTANADEVMLAFGYRPDYFRGQATYENQRAAKVAVWSDVYLEKLDVLGSEVDRQLLPDPNESAGFDVSEVDALRESQDALSLRVTRLTYADVPTINEAREQMGLDPIPDGDVTLTAYRAKIKAEWEAAAGGAAVEPPSRTALARSVVTPSAHTSTRLRVRTRGRTVRLARGVSPAVTMPTARRRSKAKVLAAYDTHERIGAAVFAALAARQKRAALRALDKMRTSQIDLLTTHERTHDWTRLDPVTDASAARAGLTSGRVENHDGDVGVVIDGRVLHVTLLPMLARCGCTRVAADSVFDASYWTQETYRATESWLTGTWRAGEASITDEFGLNFDDFDPDVLKAMDERRAVLASTVTDTTRRVLDSSILKVGAQEGWSVDDVAQAITATFDDMEDWRARTIARTETVAGFNHAAHITATASGMVTARSWLATSDARTRPSHNRVNGETVDGPDAVYSNGLRFPGDPYGPPRETVNCRCVETFDVG
jgi:HK97 family phage portal protein